MNAPDSIPTRQTLLARLKDWGDEESWREFFDLYWRLIHTAGLRAGLTDAEAQDVVQEVMLAAARKMPGFTYEPDKDSLKGWLLAVTRWKVADQFRKREKPGQPQPNAFPDRLNEETQRTPTVERVPDPGALVLEGIWDAEWRENLLRTALDRVKRRANPAQYEMYYLHVVRRLSARETARALGVSTAAVHLAKHRVGKMLTAEVKRLERREP